MWPSFVVDTGGNHPKRLSNREVSRECGVRYVDFQMFDKACRLAAHAELVVGDPSDHRLARAYEIHLDGG